MTLLGQTSQPASPTPPPEVDIRTPSFWIALALLTILACLLIYGIFETRFRVAVATGASAIELMKRNTRRLWILIAGTGLILLGIVISPLPGPGFILLAPVGLGILATEFAWARRLKLEIQRRASPLENAGRHVADRTPRWVVIPALLLYWCIPSTIILVTSLPPKAVFTVASALFAPFILWAWMVFKGSSQTKPPEEVRQIANTMDEGK
ncbi:MAG: PGPGW domain-containing protein [Phycisphaerales bacterium]